jgi:formylmethanofuran dehydrogenase subunit E
VTNSKEILSLIENATRLHGHLGPFLVIGVRMGDLAKRCLHLDDESCRELQVTVKTPLSTPFTCVIDGIQATTRCTIGNQRLRVEESTKEISAQFKLRESGRTLRISVNTKLAKTLLEEMSKGAEAERLAGGIARMQEHELFVLEE